MILCQSCEILSRSLIGLGADAQSTMQLLNEKYNSIVELRNCISLILFLDKVEETTGNLDFNFAVKLFENTVGSSELRGNSITEISNWAEKMINFAELERRVKKRGYGAILPKVWYEMKSIDVKWSAYQILRLSGKSQNTAENIIKVNNDKFSLLEIYDDVVDQEHHKFWEKVEVDKSLKYGEQALKLGNYLSHILHIKMTAHNQNKLSQNNRISHASQFHYSPLVSA